MGRTIFEITKEREQGMSKEQEIFQNMRHQHGIRKCNGKWVIRYSSLYCAIKEAGYKDDETIWKIMEGMERNGYIRQSRNVNGKTYGHLGNYIITKWVN